MNKKGLYLLALIASLAGWAWLAANYFIPSLSGAGIHFCIFRIVTGIPCPACGSTHSMLSLMQGDIADALYWNPIGMILSVSMIVFPVWILADWMISGNSFYRFYKGFEELFRKRWILIPALLLIAADWIWNIVKGF